ncbi:MAG: phenylalanine--tRNA ligase subunit beta [Anaerolineales bacterium]|nr:phenylalanine--tRNA ligase subunit beta [Anaerolineae bacterium]PWB71415.1 MAG: phenylalanine--tRNA ligase subunit beta [Anaerolineales bacterium]
MKLPISWLKDFIDLDGLSVEEIARKLTLAGLEVEEIKYVGLPVSGASAEGMHSSERHEFKTSGIGWDREKIVVAEIREVNPHPNADRLTLLDLYDGQQSQVVLTGAPNIFHLKGTGKLARPIKVAYAKEGSTIYDGHTDGLVLTTLKRAKIRGVESYSMVCSEKELGISEEHEGIIILDDDAPVGMPLVDYMGDAVLDISILPNMARNASVIGVARELAALTGRELKKPSIEYKTHGESVEKLASIQITEPELNPRFVLGLIRNVEIKPSPYKTQRRLRLAGIRPINNIVDATNYAMLDQGEPLHAFDYDVLKERAGNKNVKIITRAAKDGEKLTTLDDVERKLTSANVLVCDEKGPLSIAGVMGGAESEVSDGTRNILLEGAAWNFINIRKTAKQHNLPSEASFRFSRGVHPSLAETGVRRGLQLMAEWSGGEVAPGLVDAYPLKPKDSVVDVTPQDVKRLLGIDLTVEQISELLTRLEFKCEITKDGLRVTAPSHRLDIGEGVVGLADVLEEVARSYGYDNIPETRMADALPPQIGNPVHEWEEHLRDILVSLGLQEIVSYRLTSPERESRVAQYDEYVTLANPITPDRRVMRRNLVASVLEVVEHNARAESNALFELGPVFEPVENDLPDEPRRLVLAMTGSREALAWDVKDSPNFDFYDMKGRVELLLSGLRYTDVVYAPTDTVNYLHPGKAAEVRVNDKVVGVFGELHPLVKDRYEVEDAPILVAEFDLDVLHAVSPGYEIKPVPDVPPVLEDIAVIVDESVPASRVEALIRQTGGRVLTNVRLFDLYRGEQIGAGKKSLAYSLTYQSDKTMTDAEAAAIRNKIVKRLEHEVKAKLRS